MLKLGVDYRLHGLVTFLFWLDIEAGSCSFQAQLNFYS
jgi:hypothetical protein